MKNNSIRKKVFLFFDLRNHLFFIFYKSFLYAFSKILAQFAKNSYVAKKNSPRGTRGEFLISFLKNAGITFFRHILFQHTLL